MAYAIGIDLGGTKIAYGLVRHGRMVAKEVIPSDPKMDPTAVCEMLAGHINDMLKKLKVEKNRIAGVGMLMPGHMDFDNGKVITCSNLPLWKQFPVKAVMEEKCGLPVFCDNDANGAAIGEFMLGAGKGSRHMLYVTISTGIGGGIIINRQLFRGTYGSAGEFGHNIIDKYSVLTCGCGRHGCVEALASGTGMVKRAKFMRDNGLNTSLKGDFTAADLGKAAAEGDPVASLVLKRAIDDLGLMISNLYQTFNIRTVVVGGGVTNLGSDFLKAICEKAEEYTPMMKEYPINLVPAQLGADTAVYGAAALVLSEGNVL